MCQYESRDLHSMAESFDLFVANKYKMIRDKVYLCSKKCSTRIFHLSELISVMTLSKVAGFCTLIISDYKSNAA